MSRVFAPSVSPSTARQATKSTRAASTTVAPATATSPTVSAPVQRAESAAARSERMLKPRKNEQALSFEPRTVAPPAAPPRDERAGGASSISWMNVQLRERAAQRDSNPAAIQQTALSGITGPGAALPHMSTLKSAFGDTDLSSVRAHTGDRAAVAAASIGADAYAVGNQIAFANPNPSLHLVAHEVAHVVQQRAGVHLKGGVGEAGDPYERQADQVADAVVRGQSVAPLLQPIGSAAATSAAPAVQRNSVDNKTKQSILNRIKARGGQAQTAGLSDEYYGFGKDTGYAAIGVASMADDVAFETVAQAFEARLGALAYNHSKTRAVCKEAGARALAYIDNKHRQATNVSEAVEQELLKMGMDKSTWSGAVGKSAKAIDAVLRSGSINEQIAHIESFVLNILNADMLENTPNWKQFAGQSQFDMQQLDSAQKRVKGTNDRYLAYDVQPGEASAGQWHTRIGVKSVPKGRGGTLPMHPSSYPKRPKDRLEKQAPLGLGTKLGDEESKFQQQQTGKSTELGWEEGARIWVLNELDSWVAAQRALSLPLAGGMSSTTARIMQAFAFLGINQPDDVRLAAIGAMLPPRHHTLVEVMHAARPFGASQYREGPMMYRDVKPLTEQEIMTSVGDFPDVLVDPNKLRGGKSFNHKPLQEGGPTNEQEPNRTNPVVKQPKTFNITRAMLKARGVSNFFEDRNSAQARMLRAIDSYHEVKDVSPMMALRTLTTVRSEAAHWLSKHEGIWKRNNTINLFKQVRNAAGEVIDDYQKEYLTDLKGGNMLASAANAQKGQQAITLAGQDLDEEKPKGDKDREQAWERKQLINQYGLTAAEVAALATYVGPAYQFINPSLENEPGRVGKRLRNFLKETKSLVSENVAETARHKLDTSQDPTKRAMEETGRHTALVTLALDKLPVFTGRVYAGGACTKKEAMARFPTGATQVRGAFASSSYDVKVARKFADEKADKLAEDYKRNPKDGNEPYAYVLSWESKTGRKIQAFAALFEEAEVLFAPNSTIRIVKGADQAATEVVYGTVFHRIEVVEL